MKLNEQQLRFFHTFGYLHVGQLFSADEIGWITREFETALNTFGGGDKHDGSKRTMLLAPCDRTARLCTLVDDSRIVGIASAILGEDFNYAIGDGNYYAGDTGWHPDGNWGQLFACKIAFYLDPVARDSGCLRVIPGSHKPEHYIRANKIHPGQALEDFGIAPRDFPGNVALESKLGDIVVFNHDLYHAAFGGSARRRMFTMNLTRQGKTPEDIKLVRDYVSHHSAGGYNVALGAGMYTPIMLDTAGEARKVHLRQCAQIHDELFPQFARQ